jgi:uncharacterized protein YukE
VADIDSSTIMVQDELEGAGAYIRGQAQAVADELSRLQAKLAPLPDFWRGTGTVAGNSAADQFQQRQQEWNNAAEGLFGPDGDLGLIAHAMDVAWANYSEAEWANIQSWQ